MEHMEKGIPETLGSEVAHSSQSMDLFDSRAEISPQIPESGDDNHNFDPDARIENNRQEVPQSEITHAETQTSDVAQQNASDKFDPDARIDVDANIEQNAEISAQSLEENSVKNNTDVIPASDFKEGRLYYDDKGQLYRVGDNLCPNNEYDINGYHYRTDDNGRTISAEGQLRLRSPEFKRNMEPMEKIGKGDQKKDDDRGHEIGYQFGGSGGIENVVAMDRTINQERYAPIEKRLGDAIRDGARVYLKFETKYEGDSFRPTGFKITTTMDGEKSVYNFKN